MRVPLYSKILLWLLLYLLLLGGGLYVFIRVHFHPGLDSLLAGPAGERVKSLSTVIVSELEESPRFEWNQVLRRFGDAYHLKFYLFRDATQLGGEPVQLPGEVRSRLGRHPNPGEPPADKQGEHPERPPFPGGPHFEPGHPEDAAPSPALLHTSKPSRYWLMVRIPFNPRDPHPPRPLPIVLVVESPTLSAGGLFFEIQPWLEACGGVLVFSMLFWFPIIGSMTHAISKISDATGRISEGRFDVRVPTGRNDELGLLADSVNRMGGRLEGFVTGQKRFLGDIAHELCSPLARLQVALAILEEPANASSSPYVADVREDVQEMAKLVEELLSFSKASLGAAQIRLQSVNLREIAQKAVSRQADPAAVEVEIPEVLQVNADPGLLLRALSNLVRNACRYAGHAGPVRILAVQEEAGRVRMAVEDCGPGIPAGAMDKIFDPFYRPDLSRDRDTGGFGLGLAIVKTCVESCGGTVACQNRIPTGLRVEILLRNAEF